MKLTFVDDYELAAVTDDGVVSLTADVAGLDVLPPQQLMNHVIANWSRLRGAFETRIARTAPTPLASVRLRAPLPRPVSIVCMAVNYMENGLLKEKPAPQAFFKNSHAVIGHGDTMHLPDLPATVFEGEAELAVVIGKPASRVSVHDAYDYIFGFLNFVDGSARGAPMGMGMPYVMKGQDESAPLGPWITTRDEIADPMRLHVRQWNNGKVTHDYDTSDMAHDIAASLAFITANTRLEPGDVVALGTNHQGLHPLQHGDLVEQEIDGLGRLAFRVHDDLERSWGRHTRAEWRDLGNKGHATQTGGKYA